MAKILLILLSLAVTLNASFALYAELKTPANFEECVAAGNIVLKTFPAKCVTKEGKSFWKGLSGFG